MALIVLSAYPRVHSVEVFTPDTATGLCKVLLVFNARIGEQYFQFPMESSWLVDSELVIGDLIDDGAINDVLDTYGYVLP